MKRTLMLILSAALLLGAVQGFAAEEKKAEEKPKIANAVGAEIPDFTFKDALSGADVNFQKDIKGKGKYVIVFMNTGCSACLAELRTVDKVLNATEGKVKGYCVAVDRRGEQIVKAYNDQYKFGMTYLLDENFTLPPKFGFAYTPAMIVGDKAGKIVMLKGGFDPSSDEAKLNKELSEAIK